MAHSPSGRLERKLLADLGSLDFLVVVVVGGGVGSGDGGLAAGNPDGVAPGTVPPGDGGGDLLPVTLVAA